MMRLYDLLARASGSLAVTLLAVGLLAAAPRAAFADEDAAQYGTVCPNANGCNNGCHTGACFTGGCTGVAGCTCTNAVYNVGCTLANCTCKVTGSACQCNGTP